MKQLVVAGAVLLGANMPAAGMEILHCSDTDAIGYQWQDGRPKATRYVPYHFIVKIISKTERIIDGPNEEYNSERYTCTAVDDPGGVLSCIRPRARGVFPVNFRGDKYERVGNMSAQIGGAPDLYVAYGSCEPF